MADIAMQGIKNSYSLLSFAKSHGRMQIGDFTNKETGEVFKSCIFTDESNPDSNTNKTFVAFSSKLGTLTPSEISARKDDLQVVQLESNNYILCAKGASSWADVSL